MFTSGTRILQIRGYSGGHILWVGARQQRRSLVHAVRSHVVLKPEKWRAEVGGGSWPAPSLLEARRSSPAAGGRCSWSSTSSALWAAWRGRSFAANPAPFLRTRGGLWVKIPHTAMEFGLEIKYGTGMPSSQAPYFYEVYQECQNVRLDFNLTVRNVLYFGETQLEIISVAILLIATRWHCNTVDHILLMRASQILSCIFSKWTFTKQHLWSTIIA